MVKCQKFLSLSFLWVATALAGEVNGGKPQTLTPRIFDVCGLKLKLEIADTPEKRTIGLMNRQNVAKGGGMIFVFPSEELRQFWMRNVPFSIDIAYFDLKGKILNIHTMLGTTSLMLDSQLPRYESKGMAKYAVEVESGFFKKIKDADKCKLHPLLKTTR